MEDKQEHVGDRIKRLRMAKQFSGRELARLTGISDTYISLLENHRRKSVSHPLAIKLANVLGVTPDDIHGYGSGAPPPHKTLPEILEGLRKNLELLDVIEIPLFGFVPGGTPWTPEDTPIEYICIPKDLVKDAERPYAVRLSGDSLEGYGLHNGDTLIVDCLSPFADGHIFIVRIGNEVTAKKVYRQEDRLKLVGTNGSYEIMEPHRVENLGRVMLAGNWRRI